MLQVRVSNTAGNLLEMYKVSLRFSALVCEFVPLSLILVTISECMSTEYLAVYQDQLILRLVIPGKCQLSVSCQSAGDRTC